MIKTTPSKRRIGSAHVLAAAALFVALGGTATAKDAVRAFITGAEVRNGSLTGRDVRNRSLTAADLAPGVLRAGPQGPAGPQGTPGERGERGETGPAGPDLAGATHVRVRGDKSPAENGEALRAALASISDASQAKPYVIQLAPGVYGLDDRTLAMKPDVSIAGAGAAATRIVGDQSQAHFGEALVLGANRTLLRDVTVANAGSGTADFKSTVAVSGRAAMWIEDAVLEAHARSYGGFALLVRGNASVDVRDSRLVSDSSGIGAGASVGEASAMRIRGSELVATQVGGMAVVAHDSGSTALVENSAIESAHWAVYGPVTVGASRVVGDIGPMAKCVSSYNGDFAPLNAGCS